MAAHSAQAGVPGPTLTIRTTIHGQPSDAPLTRGEWRVAKPGRSASLTVSGVNPVDGRTTVVALWTSHTFHPGRGTAVKAVWSLDEDGATSGTAAGTWSVQGRVRHGSSGWSKWDGPDEPFHLGPGVVTFSSAAGQWWVEFPQPPRGRWQFQVRLRYALTATSRHSSTVTVSTAR